MRGIMGKADNIFTDRLKLREIMEGDTDIIVRWRSNPEVYQFFYSPHLITKEEHLQWFYGRYLNDSDQISFIALEKLSKNPIGVFGIKRIDFERVEVSYLLDEMAQGKGYAGEAVVAMITFARRKWAVSRAVAEIHKDNVSSIKMIRRLQFNLKETHGTFLVFEREWFERCGAKDEFISKN